MAEEKVIVTVEQNEYIPVSFAGRFPVVNPKVTDARFTVYTFQFFPSCFRSA